MLLMGHSFFCTGGGGFISEQDSKLVHLSFFSFTLQENNIWTVKCQATEANTFSGGGGTVNPARGEDERPQLDEESVALDGDGVAASVDGRTDRRTSARHRHEVTPQLRGVIWILFAKGLPAPERDDT